ncbi:hypothetical protein [Pararhizobium haloflavum]|uniref:hypothetical protein n=1 Tax=Pararhizobium haloflavum TaxID=2037914 RepID=UPI0013000486|nr:hypothetical protein [Pararhizobium haloflavum]
MTIDEIEAGARYRVTLAKPVRDGTIVHRPRQMIEMSALKLTAIIEQEGADVIATAERV